MIQRFFALFAVVTASVACARAADKVDFQDEIAPIFAAHCTKCHGEAKAHGKMRLDTVAGIQAKLTADSKLLVAGKPTESELFQRITLPAESRKRMPKGGDPLSPDAIELISRWIDEGAVLSAAVASSPSVETHDGDVESPKQSALPEVPAAPAADVDRLVTADVRVALLCADSNLLVISFAGRGEPAGDADVALLSAVAEQIYSLNLADAKVSPAGLAPLAAMKNLNALHLERSNVTDDGLAPLQQLAALEYLNLYGTAITDEGLSPLKPLSQLRRLYLWQSKVSYDAATSLEKDIPGLLVNLGFDHPEVARRRLTKELESAKKQLEAAKAETAKVEQRLKDAQTEATAAAARVSDVEKQLQALNSPASGS
jgi:mono/diheme cytochrome c family protein